MGRIFAIPDLHARNDLLQELLETLKNTKSLDLSKDKLIFLGDYIDRFPNSKEVIQTIIDLQTQHPENVFAVIGNHEQMAIDACLQGSHDKKYLWFMNGGDATVKSYIHVADNMNTPAYMDPEHIRWMSKLPRFHLEDGFFFSHAPVHKDYNGDFLDLSTWTYLNFVDEEADSKDFGNKVGVCGHIHRLREGYQTKPRMYKHYIFADSGCGCHSKAPLTCIEVVSREVITIWPSESLDIK